METDPLRQRIIFRIRNDLGLTFPRHMPAGERLNFGGVVVNIPRFDLFPFLQRIPVPSFLILIYYITYYYMTDESITQKKLLQMYNFMFPSCFTGRKLQKYRITVSDFLFVVC